MSNDTLTDPSLDNSTAVDAGDGGDSSDDYYVWTDEEIFAFYRDQALSDPTFYTAVVLYALAAIPMLVVLGLTCHRLYKTRSRFLVLMFLQNVMALWYMIYCFYSFGTFFLCNSWPRSFSSACSQLLNQLLFFGRFGLFRPYFRWYTERLERILKIGVAALWISVFWLHLLWIFVDYGVIDLGPPYKDSSYTYPVLVTMKAQLIWVFFVIGMEVIGSALMMRGIFKYKDSMLQMFTGSHSKSHTKVGGSASNLASAAESGTIVRPDTKSTANLVGSGTKSGTTSNATMGRRNANPAQSAAKLRTYRILTTISLYTMVFFDALIIVWTYLSTSIPDDSMLWYVDAIAGGCTLWHYVASAATMYFITAMWKS